MTTVIALVAFFVVSVAVCYGAPRLGMARRIAGIFLAIAVVAYVYVLVQPSGGWAEVFGADPDITLNPIASFAYTNPGTDLTLAMVTLNALLFVPLAIPAFVAVTNRAALWLFGPVLSVLIETFQAVLGTGRQSDIMDVLANSLGYVIGVAMMYAAHALVGVREQRAPVT
ncbi:VanZ family protein [Nocardiopsis kunsanensis]|uniref:VanZ family protein n=1 Tax=Nocardiopsis kunsanensis TaxID=141693 RepID=UPI001360B48B|nr:VanZ family protein [Nocardiopsis kunsanensis]